MESISALLADLKEHQLLDLIERRVAGGDDPLAIIEECRQGMEVVGQRFEAGEYFLSELIMSAEILKQVAARLPYGSVGATLRADPVVVGTVKGDIHDIGKDIVITMLRTNGFEVIDLGVDVSTARFVESVKSTRSRVLGLSGLITPSFDAMKDVITALAEEGLRDRVTVLIGGGPVNEEVRRYVGADHVGKDAQQAVKLCKAVLGGGGQ